MNDHHDIHVHFHVSPELAALGQNIFHMLRGIASKQETLMATIQDVKDAVARQSTVEQSAITLLQQISAQLKDAMASNDPQAMSDLVSQLDSQTQALADAVSQNTPNSTTPTA